jgi:glucosylceramidase
MKYAKTITLTIIILTFLTWVSPACANLLTNGGFEDGSTGQIGSVTIPGWSTWGSSGWHHNDAGLILDTKAVKLWWTDTGIYQDFTAAAGNTYRLSGYILHASGDALRDGDKSGDFRVEWYDTANTKLREDTFGKITKDDPTDTWIDYSADITAPAGTIYGRYLIRMYQPTTGDGTVHYDNVSVVLAQSKPDFNNDFHVDFADYRYLSGFWQQFNPQYDLNDDNIININDLIILAENWLTWQDPANAKTVAIDPATTFQEIEGFGASLTDSSAWLIHEFLNATERQAVLTELFDPDDGIGLSYLRQPMGASDFRLQEYSYDDLPTGVTTDYALTHFSIAYDENYIIPTLQQILSINPTVRIMGSPWSPPVWMKTSGSIGGGSLKSNVYPTYANYFVKFIQAYAAHGIPIDAVTLQNEPYYEPWSYAGCRMEPADQVKLVKEMGPAFMNNNIATKILVWDHNWDNTDYALTILADSVARGYIDGVAWHHYSGDASAQTTVHNAYPDIATYFTEGSDGTWNDNGFDADLMRNGIFVVDTIRNWAKVIVKWNLALDQSNGPKIAGGCDTCYGVVSINQDTRQVTPKPHYYALGHASKFLQPGAVRIASSDGNIRTVAFKNTDESVVLYAVNSNASGDTLKLEWSGQWAIIAIPARSIITFRWDNQTNARVDVYLSTGDQASLLEHRSDIYFHN